MSSSWRSSAAWNGLNAAAIVLVGHCKEMGRDGKRSGR